MAIRWLEARVRENNRQKAPPKEHLEEFDRPKDLDLFETMCKILNISLKCQQNMGQKTTDAMVQIKPDFLVVILCQKHMSKHNGVYSLYQTDI